VTASRLGARDVLDELLNRRKIALPGGAGHQRPPAATNDDLAPVVADVEPHRPIERALYGVPRAGAVHGSPARWPPCGREADRGRSCVHRAVRCVEGLRLQAGGL
jgi:hypothetical protein